MKKLMAVCMMLVLVASAALAGKDKGVNVNLSSSEYDAATVLARIADLRAELDLLRATNGDQTEVRAELEKLSNLPFVREANASLDLACADCAPAHADLGAIGTVVWGYFVSGDLGTDGKWVARFDGVGGNVYHWDLCPSAPGAGTNAGFSPNDIDIRIKDAACLEIAYNDGVSGCVPAWSPNDWTWACPATGTYYVELKDYSSGDLNCNGVATMTFSMNYYTIGALPPPVNDLCPGALPLAVPGTTTGSTADATDNYNAVCPYTSSGKDVVFSYMPAATQDVTFSLCLSSYDTKLYISTECPPVNIVACSDDASPCPGSFGPYRSLIECVTLLGGQQYYVFVDGYSASDFGDYVLEASICEACDVICPEGSVPEGEPLCQDEYVDTFNGGCNDPAGSTSPLPCGTTVCGTSGTYLFTGLNYRDTDWYLITVTDDLDSNWFCLNAEFNAYLVIYPVAPCEDINSGLVPALFVGPTEACVQGCWSFCLPAGDYYVIVVPQTFAGVPCGAEYVLSRVCMPCQEPFVCRCGEYPNTHCAEFADAFITDFNSTCVTINVPVEYHITDLNVCLDITHTFDGDLDITLTSPNGTVIELSTDNGGSGQDYTCTTFDDEASGSVVVGSAPFSGSYQPETPLSAVDGENAVGPWVLCVYDDAGGDVGTINWLCLTFEYDEILPVAFGGIDAVTGNGLVTLNWSTESETSVDFFELSRDGAVVANVDAQNSATGASYSYTDNGLTNGVSYSYSLVAVSINGDRQTLATLSATPEASAVISEYALHQNYPNPFNPTTNIAFDMVEAGNVTISVYNVMGQKVAELVNGNMEAGRHVVSFDAAGLSSGLYLYKMEANGFTAQAKMVLMK